MINLNKKRDNITKSERPKDSEGEAYPKKQDHHNKFWYKNFEDLVNFQHTHGGITDMKRREKKQLS